MSLWLTTKRVARYGLIGFLRNGFVSLSAILIMSITLFVIAGLLIFGAAMRSVLSEITSKVDVTVYFTTNATDAQVQGLQQSLTTLPEVSSIVYVSRDQALQEFQSRHQNDQLTMQALEELGDNPLGASLEIKAKDPTQYESIAKYLATQQQNNPDVGSAIDKINFFQNKTAIDKLTAIIDSSRRIGIALAIFFGAATILIAFNTIRLAIYTARDEIGVMNLVGASHWYVRGPFMIAGVLYGVASALIVLIILYPFAAWVGPGSERFLGSFNVFSYYVSSFPLIFLVLMVSGVALGSVSSYLAVRRYLR
jgi:cell division transport system permease protein